MKQKQKVVCIKSLYFNITKPYFQFEEGKIYDCLIYKPNRDGPVETIYYFDDCDYSSYEMIFRINFLPISEYRDNQIDKII